MNHAGWQIALTSPPSCRSIYSVAISSVSPDHHRHLFVLSYRHTITLFVSLYALQTNHDKEKKEANRADMPVPTEPQFIPEKLQQALHSLLTILPEISTAMEERFGNVPPPYDPSAVRTSQVPSTGALEQLTAGRQLVTTIPPAPFYEIDTPLGEYCEQTCDYFVVPTAAVFTTVEWEWDVQTNGDHTGSGESNHEHVGHNDGVDHHHHYQNTTVNGTTVSDINGIHEDSNGHAAMTRCHHHHHNPAQASVQQSAIPTDVSSSLL